MHKIITSAARYNYYSLQNIQVKFIFTNNLVLKFAYVICDNFSSIRESASDRDEGACVCDMHYWCNSRPTSGFNRCDNSCSDLGR